MARNGREKACQRDPCKESPPWPRMGEKAQPVGWPGEVALPGLPQIRACAPGRTPTTRRVSRKASQAQARQQAVAPLIVTPGLAKGLNSTDTNASFRAGAPQPPLREVDRWLRCGTIWSPACGGTRSSAYMALTGSQQDGSAVPPPPPSCSSSLRQRSTSLRSSGELGRVCA